MTNFLLADLPEAGSVASSGFHESMEERADGIRRRNSAMIKITLAVAATVLVTAIAWLPVLLVRLDSDGQHLDTVQRVQATGQARQMILQAIGGLAVLLGAYVAYRRLRINEAELRISRDGQVTERFTRAVEHLGSGSADVRIGGIHALERISRNSPADRDAVVAILSALARGRSPWPPQNENIPVATANLMTLGSRAPDVQAAVSALGLIPRSADGEIPRLAQADLRRARMWGLNFDRASISNSNLQRARLGGCSMIETDLGDSDLREANLAGADLTGALLWNVDLTGAVLTDITLRQAKYDANTKWPQGFDLSQHEVIQVADAHLFYRRF